MMGGMSPGDASRWLGEGRGPAEGRQAQGRRVLDALDPTIVPRTTREMSYTYSSVAIDSVVPDKLIKSDQDSIYFSCIVDQTESHRNFCRRGRRGRSRWWKCWWRCCYCCGAGAGAGAGAAAAAASMRTVLPPLAFWWRLRRHLGLAVFHHYTHACLLEC